MIQAGTSYALATTAVLRDWFGISPASAFGYSMGEGSMLWALGVWQAGDEARRRLAASPLFTTRLVGPCEAVAGLDDGGWTSVVVSAPAAELEERIADEPRVWMTHVHAPREVVLGGAAADVRRVVESLAAEWFPAPVRAAIHCDAMAAEHDALVALHRLPVVDTPPVRFYTAADYGITSIESERLAQNVARATCRRMDFVRLVEQVWGDGARVFVELGPGAACTRWIGEILSGRDHAAVSVDSRGQDDASALVRALARLVAEQVPLRRDALCPAEPDEQADEPRVMRTVSLCGPDLVPFSRAHDGGSAPVLDEAALLSFAGGSIADAFGDDYAAIDGYRRRVRLPLPPYLLVSRVTALTGRRGVFEPSSVTTEYDVPRDAWYTVDGQVPIAVAIEAGQCDLLLISYLGIDFDCRGDRIYRLLDCTLTFRDALPMEGTTLSYEIRINSFARMGETLLFFFEYDCYAGDRLVLEMRNGCAGFFTDAELAQGRGVVDSREYLAARADAERMTFDAPLRCGRRRFDADDLRRLGEGDLAGCFGPDHDPQSRNPSLRLPPDAIRMIDRIVDVDPEGGAWGLGLLMAEKDLAPDDWYFPCHFLDDQVLAGSLMADGCSQLLQFYLLYLGLHTGTADARFQPVAGVAQHVVCRGQVTPEASGLGYRMEITALEGGTRPSARANCDIVVDGRIVVRFTDLALELAEKTVPLRGALYDERQVYEFTLGSVAACFGPDFAVHEGRRVPRTPNGDLQLLTRVVDATPRGVRPEPGAWLESEYDVPNDPWFVRESAYPATPYSVLMEIGLQPCGFLSAHQGTSLIDSDADLYFRNLDGTGHLHREVDLRGRTARARVELTSSTALSGVILQKFTYELGCDGDVFFDGEAAFGYFQGSALVEQIGLDSGRSVPSWLAQSGLAPAWVELGGSSPLFGASPGRPHERLPGPKLRLLDRAAVVPDGGRHGLGYVFAEAAVDTSSWYFPCHFYLDPVMPGSLGIESIIEAIQCLALADGPHPAVPLAALRARARRRHRVEVQGPDRGRRRDDGRRSARDGSAAARGRDRPARPRELVVRRPAHLRGDGPLAADHRGRERSRSAVVRPARGRAAMTTAVDSAPAADALAAAPQARVLGAWRGEGAAAVFDERSIRTALLELDRPLLVVRVDGRVGVGRDGALAEDGDGEVLAIAPPLPAEQLGDPSFRSDHGVALAYAAGAMANGIASETFVTALGRAGLLATFGAAGLAPPRIDQAIDVRQRTCPTCRSPSTSSTARARSRSSTRPSTSTSNAGCARWRRPRFLASPRTSSATGSPGSAAPDGRRVAGTG